MRTQEFIRRLAFLWVAQDADAMLKLVGRFLTENKSGMLKEFNYKFLGRREEKSILDWKYMLEGTKDRWIKSMLKSKNFS